jgi:hypothetical protein
MKKITDTTQANAYIDPETGIEITYNGNLDEKIRLLEMLGISYTPTSDEVIDQADIDDLRDQVQVAKDRLTQIITALPPGTQAQFNTQVWKAVQDMALYERKMILLVEKRLFR